VQATTGSEGWSKWLQWADPDGQTHKWLMPAGLAMQQTSELEVELANRGLEMSGLPNLRTYLRRGLAEVTTTWRVRVADMPGWCPPGGGKGSAFVLVNGDVIGGAAEPIVLRRQAADIVTRMAPAGDLAGWKYSVAGCAVGNPIVAFAIAAAFAGPLIGPLGETSGGFHFFGRSKAGKTLALLMAVSASAPPNKRGMLKDWRTTANALEGAAVECNDGLLALDEIHQAEPREVVGAVYQIANGSGKSRMTREAATRAKLTWSAMVLSSGEIDVATVAAKAGPAPLPAGAEVRLPSIPIDGCNMWPDLHGERDAGDLMAMLHKAVATHHGHALPVFLRELTNALDHDNGELAAKAQAMRDRFYARLPDAADGQVKEVARRCALVALSGELAIEWGVLPWEPLEATSAAETIMDLWLGRRDGVGATEESQHVKAVRAYLSEHGASRFVHLRQEGDPTRWIESHPDRPIISRTGWRRNNGDGDEYLIDRDGWQKMCAGADPGEVAKTLRAAGHLGRGDGKNLSRPVRIPRVGSLRCYIVKPSILAEPEIAVTT